MQTWYGLQAGILIGSGLDRLFRDDLLWEPLVHGTASGVILLLSGIVFLVAALKVGGSEA